MRKTWSMRPYSKGDEEGIFELSRAVYPQREFDRNRWLKEWQWMYENNPSGHGWIWIAEGDGKIVGHSSIIPVALKIADETVIGFQSINTMTHPDFSHQGIYQALAKKTYAEAAAESVHIGFRFPNKNSRPIAINRLDWFDVSRPRVWFRPDHWKNAIKLRLSNEFLVKLFATGATVLINRITLRAKKLPVIRGLNIAQVNSFDDRITELWNRISNQSAIMVVRDKSYLNWKYCSVPGIDYSIYIAEKEEKICGYVVFRCIQRGQTKVGLIFDIFAESEACTRHLLSCVVDKCEEEEVDLLYCSLVGDKIYPEAFRNSGFASLPFIKGGWLCAYSDSLKVSKEFLRESKNWYVQTGDSDKR